MKKLKATEIIAGTIFFVSMFTILGVCGTADFEVAKAEEEWQELNGITTETETEIPEDLERAEYEADCYEVRICTAYDWGQYLVDEDGDVYCVQDPPEFLEGQLVSVMFDTKGTVNKTDDEVIDLWEFE